MPTTKTPYLSLLATLAFTPIALSSCCTVINGRSQEVHFAASPAGAKLTIDGQDRGCVPQTVLLKRGENHTIRLEAPGYAPFETKLEGSTSGWVFGNIVIGGLIGLAVDYATGAVYAFDDVNATLAPQVQLSVVNGKPAGARQVAQLVRL